MTRPTKNRDWLVVREDGSVFESFPTELLADGAAAAWNRIMQRAQIARQYSVRGR